MVKCIGWEDGANNDEKDRDSQLYALSLSIALEKLSNEVPLPLDRIFAVRSIFSFQMVLCTFVVPSGSPSIDSNIFRRH